MLLLALTSLGVGLRLINISQPFVDWWSWRQADVAMIAENFYRHGFNPCYPQINWAGQAPGYVGTEFPLVPFIAALLYVPFGVQDWVGRCVSVFFFAASVPLLYLLVKKVFNRRSAFFAVVVYCLTPLGIFAGRSFMPDTASLSFSLAAVYLFIEWLERERGFRLFLALTLATSLAILIKLPAIIIGLPLLYLAWKEYGPRFVLRRELWAFAILSLLFSLAWYAHAYLISVRYFPYHFFGEGGIKIEGLRWYLAILRQAATFSLTPVAFALMLVGVILPSPTKYGRVFHWWLIAIALFVLIAGEGNRHQWYRLPLVPVAAAFAGLACDFIWRRVARLTSSPLAPLSICSLLIAALAYCSYVYTQPFYEPMSLSDWQAGVELSRIAPPEVLVIVPDDGNPTAIYYSRRKGWHLFEPAESREAIEEIEGLRKEGAGYLIFTENKFWWLEYYSELRKYLDAHYRRVRETDSYIIFDLTASPLSTTVTDQGQSKRRLDQAPI